ncbi:hypothetical protein BIY21_18005 [Vibrio ponticus]|uniref:DUF3466 family protein n=1 Tax=Vibrio ponticus TaxID=265668 RepID=A0ABX3FAR7_9VIBR|nr:DUF3466 family protein [Vibrio ponticus]OLQ86669.1 hypothetical protein BIY21_18005 [Vibrio ponticus]
MRSNVFKLSAIAVTVCASFGAQAALYNVYSYLPEASDAKTFGVAIQPSADSISCWSTNNCNLSTDPQFHEDKQKIAFEEQVYNQGFSYRDESPFRLSFGFDYLEEGFDGFESYCDNYLGYTNEACDRWADEQYTRGYAKQGSLNNSKAYIEATSNTVNAGEDDVVVNSFATDAASAMGNFYGGSLKNRSYAYINGTTELSRTNGSVTYDQSKVWAFDGEKYIGSVSKQSTDDVNDYISYAAVWNSTGAIEKVFTHTTTADGRLIAQASLRDIVTANGLNGTTNGTKYIVGYSSDSEPRPVAAVYKLDGSEPKTVGRFSDDAYLSSILTSVNENGIAIGEVKYDNALERAYPNALFYTTNLESPNSGYSTFSGSIFFTGANGKAGAINNHNEVVGQIDYERRAEIDGTERAKRAFVTVVGDKSKSNAPFKNGSYYLDDLTSGVSSNNQYRIVDATDINDAGVISGTALYCSGGYATEDIGATCNAGSPTLVAVKLVPIQGATAADIQPRPVTETTIERQGASLGWLALGLLTLLGFRRKQ